MWIAVRSFRYRGKRYSPGDQVPAETWNIRRGLQVRGKIRQVSPKPEDVTKTQLKAMTRAELNVLGSTMGIEDAEEYPNRDSLISAIREAQGHDDEEDQPPADTSEEDDAEETVESDDSDAEDSEDEYPEEDSDEDDEA